MKYPLLITCSLKGEEGRKEEAQALAHHHHTAAERERRMNDNDEEVSSRPQHSKPEPTTNTTSPNFYQYQISLNFDIESMLSRSSRPLQKLVATGRSRLLAASEKDFQHSSCSLRPSGSTAIRHWSAKVDAEEKKEDVKESLEDTVRRMRQKDGSGDGSSNAQVDDFMQKARETWSSFSEGVSSTWEELLRSGERKDINKKLIQHHPEDTAEGDKPYTGPVDILVIDESEHLTAWERMQRRLAEAPIISDILEKSDRLYETSGAKKVKQKVDHLSEDAREAWETSQNPWVYRISSVYETMTAETPESIAVAELRKLDPDFTLDDWKQDVSEHTLPKVMEWLLKGKINQLKPWLAEGVFQRIAAEITARQQEGVEVDTHVLGIMNSEILACEPDEVNKGSPIIVLHFMCQQINCVRKKKDGTIVEGSEDDIKANSYVAAFQREYDEENAELNWKIVDFRFNGAIAYL